MKLMNVIKVNSGFFIFDNTDQGVFVANEFITQFRNALEIKRKNITIGYLNIIQRGTAVSITDGTETVTGNSDEILEMICA